MREERSGESAATRSGCVLRAALPRRLVTIPIIRIDMKKVGVCKASNSLFVGIANLLRGGSLGYF